MILDSATLYYRAFYALPEKMTAPDGHPHNAIRGFLTMLTKLRQLHSPSGLVAAWDTDWRPQWRVDLLPSYKTHRLETAPDEKGESTHFEEVIPDTLGPQIGAIADILDSMGITRIGLPNFEADDVIASFAAQSSGPNLVVSSDKDLVQVISPTTSMLLQVNGGIEGWPIVGPEQVLEKFGVPVSSYVDYAVLRGDPSDGLPGVTGIGPKTAAALIGKYGSIENLHLAIEAGNVEKPLSIKVAERIQASRKYTDKALKVVTAETALPVSKFSTGIPESPKSPKKLKELASEWGVERFVDQFFS